MLGMLQRGLTRLTLGFHVILFSACFSLLSLGFCLSWVIFFFCWWDLELLVGVWMQWLTLSQGPTLAKCWGEICCSPGIKCVSFVILVKPQTTITDRYWFSIAVIKLASEGATAPEPWSFNYLSQQPFFLSPKLWIINLDKLTGLLTHKWYHLKVWHTCVLCHPFVYSLPCCEDR